MRSGEVRAGAAADETGILGKLRARERGRRAMRGVALGAGVPLTFLGPVVLGTMFWVACGMLWHWYGWWIFFLGTSVVAIPALVVTEMRTGGRYLSEVITPEEARRAEIAQGVKVVGTVMMPRARDTLALAAVLASPRASTAGFVELFLAGPRMVLSAVRDREMLRRLRGADAQVAALLLHELLRARVGIPTARLLKRGQTMEQIELPLAYLVFYDWAGIAEGGTKVWVLTTAVEELKEGG
jgi:hypothetical protein